MVFTPNPTQRAFIASETFYNVFCGPRGEGKSVAGLFRTWYRAHLPSHKPFLPLKWAVVRDTRKNIGLTTARTIREWVPDRFARWRGKPEEPEQVTIYLNNLPFIIFDFFGVNSPVDYDRFQSYEASGGVWIEEPAPARTNDEYASSGIAQAVLAIAVTSVRGAPFPSVQLTMNPPSADHWTAQLFHIPGFEAASEYELELSEAQMRARDELRAQSAVFLTKPGENKALDVKTPGYRERNRQILMATGSTDLLARLVEGRVGYAQMGERVTPAFCAAHIAHGLQVIPNLPFLLSFDYGLNPTCIVAQVSPNGYLLIHRAFSRQNMGMKQLLQRDVQPWLAQQPVSKWSYAGGPEAREREQSDSEETALRTIVTILGLAPYQAGPVSWSARKDALDDALNRYIAGLPWVRVNPEGAALLVRTLDGGWSYRTNAAGHVMREQPDKRSRFDHLGDAFAHLVAILTRKTDTVRNRPTQKTRNPLIHRTPFAAHRAGTGA